MIYSKDGGSRTEKRGPEFSAPLAGFLRILSPSGRVFDVKNPARGAENSGPRFSGLDPLVLLSNTLQEGLKILDRAFLV